LDTIDRNLASSSLSRWERCGLVLFLALIVAFGVLVELRSAFLSRRMGDLDVFLRTAWAVRAGEDIYKVTDDNRYHYHYPPLFAILLTPLADPPAGADHAWMLPYPITVAIWYIVSIVCLALAVHWLASALEATSPDPAVQCQPRGCRRWWALRLLPVLVCLPPIGHTLMRGQVNLLLLMLLCGLAAAVVRGRSWQSGWWLAGAICLKLIPAFLLLFPLWRRDGRCLASCAAGLVLGLALIPMAVFGPRQTLAYYGEWTNVLVRPGLGAGDDDSRARELIDVTATDSQSFQAIFHNTLYPDGATRPRTAGPAVRLAHWLLGGLMTLFTLLAARRIVRREAWGMSCSANASRPTPRAPREVVLFLGSLVLIMILVSPVCHLHYFCLAVPLVMGLLSGAWEGKSTLFPGRGLVLLFLFVVIANTLPHFPICQRLRDDGLAAYAAVLLWLVGVITLARYRQTPAVAGSGLPRAA
jgi:alpha-1,2-mannosyltransferase